MKTAISKRSVIIGGRKTSISLEEAFWREVRDIADLRHVTVSELLREIDSARDTPNLSSAIRVYVLGFVRGQTQAEPPRRAVGA